MALDHYLSYYQMQALPLITKAPGKVLIAGGYGVLEDHNYGLSLALNSSFYCICTEFLPSQATSIVVRSFQIDQQWRYLCQEGELMQQSGRVNPFVENALRWSLKYFNKTELAGKIHLEIVFSQNFISNLDALDESVFPKYRSGYKKTGLGSSACVLVSIVKCLTSIFGTGVDQERLVNLISQVANLSAQNKIGSNFDISTAVYGTHLYQNQLPHLIFSQLQHPSWESLLAVDPQVKKVPSLCHSLLAYIIDVNKGADTRVMVKGFTTKLNEQDQQVREQFFNVSKQITLALWQALSDQDYSQVRNINQRYRNLQQKYTAITGVPIEPTDLTPLINSITSIDGTVYAVCPGSGGYDAIFVLAELDITRELEVVCAGHGVRKVEVSKEAGSVSKEEEQWVLQTIQILKAAKN